ncbi:hypothetical protein HFE03_03305 [Paenibacillus sp. EKM102P]|uniref:hypothetical protein n=1 Tax=unclassified Paenibacillus TaxID=185978 RepID=UPI00142E06E6|nr:MULTISPECIES: hypothetical protein [unclassified Paenibacillus]KAF6614368.1 hypothetical protein HFE00_25345 [Paenibacillus sp. EKM101P]KAF6624583.1 hypothetical protein HFE03_03305 [Paenibacillus sp. EKM102P]KAF6635638.1 hypothetical protein HFE01_01725 [Paenibacillus sp. EKM10P]KAF6648652.1 hypothetical protein HFE02_09825 [Paenibacillus sp. EKM11P]
MGPYNLELTPWEMLILRDDLRDRLKYHRGFSPEELSIWRKIEELHSLYEMEAADQNKSESDDMKTP